MDDLKDIIKVRLAELFEKETQEITAGRLQTTQSNISKWLSGAQLITTDNLYRIAKTYNVSIDWLLGISDVRDINGLNINNLTYEQVARIMDKLIINWDNSALPNFKGLKVVNNTGNMQDALDAKGWAGFQDADWINLIEEISRLSEEERTALIQEIENKKKEGQ